jgi:hypothetical protein
MRNMYHSQLSKWFAQAKKEGRLCIHCGWMIKKKRYELGWRTCWYCEDARKGVTGDEYDHDYPENEVRRLTLVKHLH